MNKIKEIIIGSNNIGKYKEISSLLPKNIKKYSPKTFNISSPEETGKTFEKNSLIKASYFCKKTNLTCISDDSGLEIDILNGQPGIYSSRWAGEKNNFNLAIKKIFKKLDSIKNKNLKNNYRARFICCLTIFYPNGKIHTSKGIINGRISTKKKGKNGFGYDPIFIPNGYTKTFGEMNPKLKMSIDHRFKAFLKIKKFF
jgi:XTP/dITP diphosphohydrolase|tara:strand:- start:549 stop:1145 length:597 start_codon:yes stop_codon:yes gene_type:complete